MIENDLSGSWWSYFCKGQAMKLDPGILSLTKWHRVRNCSMVLDWRFIQRYTSNQNSKRAVRVASVLADRWNSRHSTKNVRLEFSQVHPAFMRVDREETLGDDTITERIHLAHPNCPNHVDQHLATRYNILRVTVCRRLQPITDIVGDELW
jgi:hypothetical protein